LPSIGKTDIFSKAIAFRSGDKPSNACEGIAGENGKERDFVMAVRYVRRTVVIQLICICWLFASLVMSSGCNALLFRIRGSVNPHALPENLLAKTRNYRVPIDYRTLGQSPPTVYRLDSGDVLGIAIDGILPFSAPTAAPTSPPVNFPESDSRLPPSTGFPVAVHENGTILMPGIAPILVRGMSVDEVRETLVKVYSENSKAKRGEFYPLVSLLRQRTYNISVIRRDLGETSSASIQLEAYRNDVLNALLKTGGLPGDDAKDQVTILRQHRSDSTPMVGKTPMVSFQNTDPRNNSINTQISYRNRYSPETLPPPTWHEFEPPETIPLTRYAGPSGQCVDGYITGYNQSSILYEGDIIYIESRESEVFYTTGLIPGGQHPIPRDYDIDIFDAMAIAGYSYGKAQGTGGGLVAITGVTPTQLFVFRKTNDEYGEIPIKIDLVKAVTDPRERLVIKAGDKLLLRYTPAEEATNFGTIAFFTFGIQQLFVRQ